MSTSEPCPSTLLAAKSRGRLNNLTGNGKCIFVALEEMFRVQYPQTVSTKIDQTNFLEKCLKNRVVQNCYHSATDPVTSDKKEKVLLDLILLYFKVRVHQQCKTIMENVRRKKVDSKNQKSLRSKLAK